MILFPVSVTLKGISFSKKIKFKLRGLNDKRYFIYSFFVEKFIILRQKWIFFTQMSFLINKNPYNHVKKTFRWILLFIFND